MHKTVPPSLSVYRGQSRQGIGEGPERPIAHGEQYLQASPALAQNGELLDAIRPWMSLDSDPADHQKLQDRLESWSCFRAQGFRFVVRLAAAGIYDRRAAYFAHGRAWSLGRPVPGFDPGLHLGRTEAFEQPWSEYAQARRVADLAPLLVRPAQIAAETQVGASFLAHLFQSCVQRRSLIIAAPVTEFAAGSPLHALISFARGGLPTDLKRNCNVRIYTTTPELFLGQLGATLLALPEAFAGQALSVRRDATLLDRSGNVLSGPLPDSRALAYAEAVLERAIRIPEGLGVFAERFHERLSHPGLPDESEIRAVQITYNLAVALAGSEQERVELLRNYLPRAAQKAGPGVDWERLLIPQEWISFPSDALKDLVLFDSWSVSPGRRELQSAVERVLAHQGWTVDSRLSGWWDGADSGKLHRLLQLLAQSPPLVSASAAVERTSGLPIHLIAEVGPPQGVLAAELREGVLGRRASESEHLGLLASLPEVFDVLRQAVYDGQLDVAWARSYVERAEGVALLEAARRFLQTSRFLAPGGWGNVPERLLDKLLRERLPRELGIDLLTAGKDLDPSADLAIYLRAARSLPGLSHPPTEVRTALLPNCGKPYPGCRNPRIGNSW